MENRETSNKFRVLLVDDNPSFLNIMERYLSDNSNIEVVGKATSGEAALQMALEHRPHLVLMDIGMPGMNGLETASRIKKSLSKIRVVIVTLYDNPEYRAEAARIAVDGFIPKTRFATELFPLIQRLKTTNQKGDFLKEQPMKNILIVDDSATMRRMVRATLQGIGQISFLEAENGLAAIEKVALEEISLVLLDLNMPDMHGLEVLNFLRSHEKYRNLPVIVLTTRSDSNSREAALDAGANLYLTKPFEPVVFRDRVLEILGGRS